MTGADVIRQMENKYGEYLEMSEHPATDMVALLANEVSRLNDHVQYLNTRLQYECKCTRPTN